MPMFKEYYTNIDPEAYRPSNCKLWLKVCPDDLWDTFVLRGLWKLKGSLQGTHKHVHIVVKVKIH